MQRGRIRHDRRIFRGCLASGHGGFSLDDQPFDLVPLLLLRVGESLAGLFRLGAAVVCGAGGRYNTMPDERVDVPDYLDLIRMYMLAMLEICEG